MKPFDALSRAPYTKASQGFRRRASARPAVSFRQTIHGVHAEACEGSDVRGPLPSSPKPPAFDPEPDVVFELPADSPFAGPLREAAEPRVAISIAWSSILTMAEAIEARYVAGTYDSAAVVDLSKTLLLFHAQLVGDFLHSKRRRL